MPTALVTGPLERLSDMALALKTAGFEVLAAEPDLGNLPDDLAEVDCYVQLPLDAPAAGEDALGWARAIVTRTLVARFDTAAKVASMLAPKARIVLVADPAQDTPAPDMRLVRILVEAVVADHQRDGVQVAVVDGARPPEEIAAFARSQPPSWAAYPAIDPHLGFSDWRHEVICLSDSLAWWR